MVNEIPECNLLLSAVILFNGCFPEQSLFLTLLVVPLLVEVLSFITNVTFFIKLYFVWDIKQQSYFSQLADEDKPLVLGGDGRADSPGHSAKYGTYSLVDLNHNIVLDVQLVQV